MLFLTGKIDQSELSINTNQPITGQFEAAVDFLFRSGDNLSSHATHIALVMFELGLLSQPSNIQAALLSKEAADRGCSRRLNLARLVMLYVKHFESTDPKEALQYFYFLREMKGGSGDNLFLSCVGELVLESREFDLLLGTLMTDGSRTPGLVDKFGGLVDTMEIIEMVARDSEERGMLEDAVKLYDLATKHAKVVSLLNTLLAQVISSPATPESRRDRIQRQAVSIAKRYKMSGETELTNQKTVFIDQSCFRSGGRQRQHQHTLPPPRPGNILRPVSRWQAARESGDTDQGQAGPHVRLPGGHVGDYLQTAE